jgi:hypothetical protein
MAPNVDHTGDNDPRERTWGIVYVSAFSILLIWIAVMWVRDRNTNARITAAGKPHSVNPNNTDRPLHAVIPISEWSDKATQTDDAEAIQRDASQKSRRSVSVDVKAIHWDTSQVSVSAESVQNWSVFLGPPLLLDRTMSEPGQYASAQHVGKKNASDPN